MEKERELKLETFRSQRVRGTTRVNDNSNIVSPTKEPAMVLNSKAAAAVRGVKGMGGGDGRSI